MAERTTVGGIVLTKSRDWMGLIYSGSYRDHRIRVRRFPGSDWHVMITPPGESEQEGDGFASRRHAIEQAISGIDFACNNTRVTS